MNFTRKLKIVDVPVGELNPAPYNPRDITDAAFEGLKESIRKFGFVDPIIRNTATGLLVGGHQRLKAAQALGIDVVPVVEVELTPAEEKALNVTLNNTKISGFYTEGLQSLLDEISADLGDDFLRDLKMDELVLPSDWETGSEKVNDVEENLDGITATIKVKCPMDIKDDVLVILKRAFIETSLEGVEII